MFEQLAVSRERSGEGRSLLLQGDGSLPQQVLAEHAGQAQAVYIDPPFMTGDQFIRRRRFGVRGWKTGSPCIDLPAYDDHFDSREDYLRMLRGLIENAWLLLSPSGMLCLHMDWRNAHHARMILDEVFGEERFVNEIIWAYESGGRARRYFSRKHDVILLYAKNRHYRFHMENVPLVRGETRKNHLRKSVDEEGRTYRSIRTGGKEYRYYDDEPVYPGDVWTDISHLQQRDPERTGFITQKPLKLLDRLLRPLVQPGDLVCDLCCGSGTTLAAAEALGCRYLGMDVSTEALMVAQSRLSGADLLLQAPSLMDGTPLESACNPASGLLMLTGFRPNNEAFPAHHDGLDALERWSCGRLVQSEVTQRVTSECECLGGAPPVDAVNEMRVEQVFQRSPRSPELPPMCMLAPGEGPICVSTVDAAGKRRVYVWREDEP